MAYKPILFNTEMVQAIKAGRKTQTRRIVNPQPETLPGHLLEAGMNIIHKRKLCKLHEPYGYAARTRGELIVKPVKPPCQPGDILWVRETWHKDAGRYMYKANYAGGERFYRNGQEVNIRWSPSIHMPKEAARVFLRVKDVRVERLREMSEDDCAAEGIMEFTKDGKLFKYGTLSGDIPTIPWQDMPVTPGHAFASLWDSTIKPADRYEYGWAVNPWVWVIEFEKIEKPEGW